MRRWLTFLALLIVLVLLVVAAARSFTLVEAIESCDPIGNAHPPCGWQNLEDMVELPDGHHVIVSEYGGQNGEKSGTLSLLDLRTDTLSVPYRGSPTEGAGPWGARDCAEAPGVEFSPTEFTSATAPTDACNSSRFNMVAGSRSRCSR